MRVSASQCYKMMTSRGSAVPLFLALGALVLALNFIGASSKTEEERMCKKLCSSCKGKGILEDNICYCRVTERRLVKHHPCLERAKLRALEAGFKMVVIEVRKRHPRCVDSLRRRLDAREAARVATETASAV